MARLLSRFAKLSSGSGGDDPKRALKINTGGNTIKTNEEGCVMSQSLKPEGKSLKRSRKTNIGGNKAQPKQWKIMAKMQSG